MATFHVPPLPLHPSLQLLTVLQADAPKDAVDMPEMDARVKTAPQARGVEAPADRRVAPQGLGELAPIAPGAQGAALDQLIGPGAGKPCAHESEKDLA